MTYKPAERRVGEVGPQTDPDSFSVDDIRAEIKYLIRLDRRHGVHPLRAAARHKLQAELTRRALAS